MLEKRRGRDEQNVDEHLTRISQATGGRFDLASLAAVDALVAEIRDRPLGGQRVSHAAARNDLTPWLMMKFASGGGADVHHEAIGRLGRSYVAVARPVLKSRMRAFVFLMLVGIVTQIRLNPKRRAPARFVANDHEQIFVIACQS